MQVCYMLMSARCACCICIAVPLDYAYNSTYCIYISRLLIQAREVGRGWTVSGGRLYWSIGFTRSLLDSTSLFFPRHLADGGAELPAQSWRFWRLAAIYYSTNILYCGSMLRLDRIEFLSLV